MPTRPARPDIFDLCAYNRPFTALGVALGCVFGHMAVTDCAYCEWPGFFLSFFFVCQTWSYLWNSLLAAVDAHSLWCPSLPLTKALEQIWRVTNVTYLQKLFHLISFCPKQTEISLTDAQCSHKIPPKSPYYTVANRNTELPHKLASFPANAWNLGGPSST